MSYKDEYFLQAYQTVERAYFATMDDAIAERTSLQQELMSLDSASLDAKHKVSALIYRQLRHSMKSYFVKDLTNV